MAFSIKQLAVFALLSVVQLTAGQSTCSASSCTSFTCNNPAGCPGVKTLEYCEPSCPSSNTSGSCADFSDGCNGACQCTGGAVCTDGVCKQCPTTCSLTNEFGTFAGTCKTAQGSGDLPSNVAAQCAQTGCPDTKCYIPQITSGLCSQASNSPCSNSTNGGGCVCYVSNSTGKSCKVDNLMDVMAGASITSGGCAENACTRIIQQLYNDSSKVGACCGTNCPGRRSLFTADGIAN